VVRGVPVEDGLRRAIHARLMDGSRAQRADDILARMYASWATGGGVLPVWWGLSPAAFRTLLQAHFPRFAPDSFPDPGRAADGARQAETGELQHLLLQGRAGDEPEAGLIARVVAVACLGSNHLWQDLGVWNRADLSDLLTLYFPRLTARNTADMKWKKFFYKQLCQAEGIHTCRAPSCEVCIDYQACFGPED
jgi:nitrogen fixation protein NifQ